MYVFVVDWLTTIVAQNQSMGLGVSLLEMDLDTLHNPDRFMADLRQVLSQGRKRIGLLVGAGAPLAVRGKGGAPLIPGVEELTRKVIDGLSGQEAIAASAIESEIGQHANIESILSRTRLFKEALGSVVVNGLDGPGYEKLGAVICDKIGSLVNVSLPAERNAYNELVAWISSALRKHAIEVFTTNYDLLFEEAFEGAKAPYFDGFTGGNAPFFDPVTVAGDDLPPRWSRLWKLHGSIGWALEDGIVVRRGGRSATQLVYPDHLKYDLTQKQPYSALFERLKRFLLTPDTLLLVIGFSFRDAHICAVLDEALAMNANTAAISFQYRPLSDEAPVCKLASEHPNLTVYAADGAMIGSVPGTWHFGEMPKNWEEIRTSFWGSRKPDQSPMFLLGDFNFFARFCALTQATDFARVVEDASEPPTDIEREISA
jgi:hypothetical protein